MELATKIFDIEMRTYKFSLAVIRLVDGFPRTTAAMIIGRQLIRSATSINSNIIHAKCSLTKKEFIYFLNKSKMEAKETKSWLLMVIDSLIIKDEKGNNLVLEIEELICILVKSVKKAQGI